MSRSKSKIAVTLLSALTFSSGASAKDFGVKNFNSSGQSLGAVGGAATQVKKGMPLAAKAIFGTLGTLAGLEFIHSMIGGFTDSKLGSYSIGRAIRNRVKENVRNNPEEKEIEENDKDRQNEYYDKYNVNNPNIMNNPNVNILNKQQSINNMQEMVDKLEGGSLEKECGEDVIKYLKKVVVNNPISLTQCCLYAISTGQGVITNAECFHDHGVWCFRIEVTEGDVVKYLFLSPGLKMPNGDSGVKSCATLSKEDVQWPGNNGPDPYEGVAEGEFVGY